jgi:precorrin-6B methylase 1
MIQNAQEAKRLMEAARKIRRENDILLGVDQALKEITTAAEEGHEIIDIKVNDDLSLDIINQLQALGFDVTILSETDIQVGWKA